MSSQQAFWEWFLKHENGLMDFDADREQVFDSLQQQLNQVHPSLVFEFGPKAERREFVISADGIKDAFPAVSSLIAAAPKLAAISHRDRICGELRCEACRDSRELA
jgi:hypothetical protein